MARRPLKIGLVNSMPDAAVGAAERQFQRLLTAASPDAPVELDLFTFDEIERTPIVGAHMAKRYRSVEALPEAGVDALIVTGAEPKTADMRSEAIWDSFRRLTDWTVATQTPVLWSCLAAHAAVLHLDGVERRRLAQKCSGVFECLKTDAHVLTADMPAAWPTPHSRLNTLDERDLRAAGYTVLSLAPDAGVDAFAGGRGGAWSLFLQGHPEYDAKALAAEYQRDILRYAQGQMAQPPRPPVGYFAPDVAGLLDAIMAEAPAPDRLKSRVLAILRQADPQPVWREPWDRFYSGWLALARTGADL